MNRSPRKANSVRFWRILARTLRLHCPLCGQGRIFRTRYRMFSHCSSCGLKYEREAGYFLGSIYINYGVTSVLITIGYPLLVFGFDLPGHVIVWVALVFCLVFPCWFFRYARSLWLGLDQLFDPPENG
jgi:uncharacterized protein (DUF983 family)